MKIKTIAILGLAAAILLPASAMAQTFTVDSERKTQTSFGTPSTDGSTYFGSHTTGKSTVVMADGTKSKGKWECMAMSQPPGIFAMHILCENTSSDGNFTTVMGCNPLGKDNGMSCVGGMSGKTGDYESKTGSISFHVKGKNSTGSGQWHSVPE